MENGIFQKNRYENVILSEVSSKSENMNSELVPKVLGLPQNYYLNLILITFLIKFGFYYVCGHNKPVGWSESILSDPSLFPVNLAEFLFPHHRSFHSKSVLFRLLIFFRFYFSCLVVVAAKQEWLT